MAVAPGIRGLQACGGTCPGDRTASYKFFILVFTFVIYTSYHLSRKPISVVKPVLHKNCTGQNDTSGHHENSSIHNLTTDCGWAPFDRGDYDELFGTLDSVYLFAYAVGMFFSGHIAERMDLRYFLTFGMISSGVLTMLFGFGRAWKIHWLWYYITIQLVCGLVQSSGWPSVVTVVANWFGKGKRGLIMGIWNSHTSVGNILGSLIAGAFVLTNWGLSFIIPGIIIAVLGVFVYFFLVPKPEDIGCDLPDHNSPTFGTTSSVQASGPEGEVLIKPDDNVGEGEAEPNRAISFCAALRIPGVLEFSFSLFFAKWVSYTFLYWLPKYIDHTVHDAEFSADLSTIFDAAGIVGGITAGFVSDITGARATTCLVMLVIGAPMLYVYEAFGNTMAVNIGLLVVCGFLVNGPYALITTAVSADLGTHPSLHGSAKALATVTAIIDGTGSLGAAMGPLFAGLVLPYGWEYVFYMLIVADLVAAVLLIRLVIRETRASCCRRKIAGD